MITLRTREAVTRHTYTTYKGPFRRFWEDRGKAARRLPGIFMRVQETPVLPLSFVKVWRRFLSLPNLPKGQ